MSNSVLRHFDRWQSRRLLRVLVLHQRSGSCLPRCLLGMGQPMFRPSIVGGVQLGDEPWAVKASWFIYVSGLQLFLDFYLVTGHRGPWVCKKKWFDRALAAPEEARTTWGSRTKAFLMLFQTYLKAHKVNLSKKVTRPSSGAISHWLVSYRLRYPIARLREIDSVLFHHAGRQLTSAGDIRTFTPYQMEAA